MRVITWAYLFYVGLWSVITLPTSGVGLVRGVPLWGAATNIQTVLHIAVACVGITAVLLAVWGKRVFTWLLVVWWLPQVIQVTVATRTPTYPQNLMTPKYMVAAGPHVSVALIRELDVDKLLLVRVSLVAIIGIMLAFGMVAQRYLGGAPGGAEPVPPADADEPLQ
jgi:hypothetical protein